MKGQSQEIEMCGVIISLGDYMEVEYTNGAIIKGTVIELWNPKETEGCYCLQAKLSCNWCFHSEDRIITHTKKGDVR